MNTTISKREKEKQELSFIMTCLAVICASCVFIALIRSLSIGEESVSWLQRLPDLFTLGIMAVCCVIIFRMLSCVRHKQVFTRQNAHGIIAVGTLVEINGIVQQVCYLWMPEAKAIYQAYMIYILLGVFFIFIGCLFKLAVYIKEEQDLTI